MNLDRGALDAARAEVRRLKKDLEWTELERDDLLRALERVQASFLEVSRQLAEARAR